MSESLIDYTHFVLEATGGCTKCSSGCRDCWAIKAVHRLACNPLTKDRWSGLVTADGKNWTGKIKTFPDMLHRPRHRRKPSIWFIDSKADLFHEKVPFNYLCKVIQMIHDCPQHIFLILTKRPDRAAAFFSFHRSSLGQSLKQYCLPGNLWFGITCENQTAWDLRWPYLKLIPAGIWFVSHEPALGRIVYDDKFLARGSRSWIITGGESGRTARPMHPDWVRQDRDQCLAHNIPFFFKQWGEWLPTGKPQTIYVKDEGFRYINGDECFERVGKKSAGCCLDGKYWNQYPGEMYNG